MTVWHIKDHFTILVMIDETAANNVSELHVTVHKASDDADVWETKQMKQSHVSECQEIIKDQSTDISAHEEDEDREFDKNVRFTQAQCWMRRDHENTAIQDVKQYSEASEHLINEDISAAEWEMTLISRIKQ